MNAIRGGPTTAAGATGVTTPPEGMEQVMGYLRAHGVSFQVQHHPPVSTARQVAAVEHVPEALVAKVVVAFAGERPIMLVAPASARVCLEAVRAITGATQVRLAEEPELATLFPDCAVGALPPFGTLYDLPVYVDFSLADADVIFVPAGSHTATLSLTYADFVRLVRPTVAAFARPVSAPHRRLGARAVRQEQGRWSTFVSWGAGRVPAARVRDLRNRVRGAIAARRAFRRAEPVANDVLVARVRAALGHAISAPRTVEVAARGGRIVLSGTVPASELDALLTAAASARGVGGMENHLVAYEPADVALRL